MSPLLFNVNMIDLFYECKENGIANYAENTTPYSCGTDIATVISELQVISTKVFNWFVNNHMKANPGKFHLLLSTKHPEVTSINGIQITSSTAETLLGMTIDSKLMLLGGLPIEYVTRNMSYRDENIYWISL